MKNFDLKCVFLLSLSLILSLSCRAICFKQLISKSVNAPLKELIPLCISSAALNIVLPARAGDIFRAFFIGQKYSVNKIKIFGSVMLERLFDVFIIFCFLLVGVFIYHRNELAMKMCIFTGICILLGIIFIVFAYKFNKINDICTFIIDKTRKFPFSNLIEKVVSFSNKTCNSFIEGFEAMASIKRILLTILASIGIWIFECTNFLVTIYGFGYEIHWSVTIFIICFIALACMVPSTSIFIGPYQIAVIAAFALYGVNKEGALAISFTEQAIVTIVTAIVALMFLLKNNISFKELKEDIKNDS